MNHKELEFALFCIEYTALELGVSGSRVYDILTKESDILDSYVIPCYESLHTQGKEYIVQDILNVLREKGVEV